MQADTNENADLPDAYRRLRQAEREGLRLAIMARTAVITVALIGYGVGPFLTTGDSPRLSVVAPLFLLAIIGFSHIAVIGTKFDAPWIKYGIYGIDVIGICTIFALVPISSVDDVPQILAFRAYGIYFLFPILMMSALSLSWPLVVWTGTIILVGWWSAFEFVVAQMDRTLSWGDMPLDATTADYVSIFLSIDFIGRGNRMEESIMILFSTLILALAVYRARHVFFQHVEAERIAEQEREATHRVTQLLGQHVPTGVVDALIKAPEKLAPNLVTGTALVLDMEKFTPWAAKREPVEVIKTLDEFLAAASDIVASEGGTVISFMGDGLLATFNAPSSNKDHALHGIKAAESLQAAAKKFGFSVRIGVATGPIVTGVIGSNTRQTFTVYGMTINIAARLEALNKSLKTKILCDRATAEVGLDKAKIEPAVVLPGVPDDVAYVIVAR